MIRKIFIGLPLLALLWSCDKKEKEQLQSQVDSLKTELQVSQQTNREFEEIGVLIDSIDASRQLLRADVVEGTTYTDYKSRLQSINNHIRETEAKIADLEKSLKSAK